MLRDAISIVGNGEDALLQIQVDTNLAGFAMLDGILDGFLCDAEEVHGFFDFEQPGFACAFYCAVDLKKGAGICSKFLQGHAQIAVLEIKRGETSGEEAHMVYGPLDGPTEIIQLVA